MRILVHVPGDFNDGLDSNCRGEGRWSLNFAHMMAQHGHDVVCFGSPAKGEVPGAKVVPLIHEEIWKECDVLLDTTFWPSRAEEVDAKVKIGAYWGVDSISLGFREKYGPNHFIAHATYSVFKTVPEHVKHFTYLMPFPVAERFFWERDNAQASGLYVNWKYAWEDPLSNRRNIVSSAIMHIALDLAEEFEMPLHILHAEHVFGGNPSIRCNLPPDLRRRLENHPLVCPKTECAWQAAIEILGNSRLMLVNFEPPVSPMPVEAVALGTAPMQGKTNIFEYAGPLAFDYIEEPAYYRTTVKDDLRGLCMDSDLYTEYLTVLRSLGEVYTYDKSYPVCMEALESMLQKV